jgi:hypothetical protein
MIMILLRTTHVIDCLGRDVPANKAYWVEVPVRMVNYGVLAWATIIGAPLLWRKLGLL